MSKYNTNLKRRDPDKVERLRAVLDPLFDASLTELKQMVEQPIPEEVVQRQDPRSGEKFIDAHRRKLTTVAAKKRALSEHLSFIEKLMDLTGRDVKAEQDEIESERESEQELLRKMLAQVQKNNPKTAQEIEDETGGEFEFVAPRNRV